MLRTLFVLMLLLPSATISSSGWSETRATGTMTDAPGAAFDSAETLAARSALHRLFADEWEARLRENPLFATSVGDHRFDDQLPKVAPEDHARRAEADRGYLARLRVIDRDLLPERDRVDYDVFAFMLRHRVDGARFAAWRIPLTSESGFYMTLNRAVRNHPFATRQDYETWLARLDAFPMFMAQQIANMRAGLAEGFTLPAEILGEAAAVIGRVADTPLDASPLYAPFETMPTTLDADDAGLLRARGRELMETRVMPALHDFHRFFVDSYLPGARDTLGASELPEGEDWYASRVRFYTNLELTPRQVHEQGLIEVARIRREMDAVIEEVGFTGDFAAFIASLREDPAFRPASAEDLLRRAAWLAKKADGKLPAFFGHLPRQPYTVEPVPAALAPNYTSGRYSGAPLQGRRAAAYWVNTHALEQRTLYTLPALTLHEAVPGHHLQISLGRELEGRPPFRQYIYPHAFGEGWGLYAEKLGIEMGMYETPFEDFGRLTYEMWRACRLVVDTGMHAFGWSRDEALAYLADNTALSLLEVRTEIDRYISWPGQALAYKYGEMKIIELRRRAEAALGADFDLREFHDRVLGEGAVPLPVLEGIIGRWIEAEQAPIDVAAAEAAAR